MATKQIRQAEKGKSKIPLFQYIRFKMSKNKEETCFLNEQIIEKELEKEARIAKGLQERGNLHPGNGFEMFLTVCKRRLEDPKWHRVLEHSENVRDIACCIAETWERRKGADNADEVLLDVIAKMAGYHDIGKTMIAQYLMNREDGTWLGIGSGKRIDFRKELDVLRLSHVEAGVRLLNLYKDFMGIKEYVYSKWIIGGHHLAYDGEGSASAPSYPYEINGITVKYYVNHKRLPPVVRIMRAADVYSAIMENRFYLAESERVVTRVTGIQADDAALGLLIAVAGTDVDPLMVECLMMGKYRVLPWIAESAVEGLACKQSERLRERGGDIKFSLEQVIPKKIFWEVIGKQERWGLSTDTVQVALPA